MFVWEPDKGICRRAGKEDLFEAVYMLTMLIPIGRVTTYKSIASLLGMHPRLVGLALKNNKEPIVIPCHRVIGSDGSLKNYSMGGKEVKKKLLELEGVRIVNGKVDPKYIVDIKRELIS